MLSAPSVDLPIGFQRTVKQLARAFNVQHQGSRGIPAIHQDSAKRQLLRLSGVIEKVRQCVIDLTAQKVLAVIKSRRSFVGRNHPAIIYIIAFCVSPIRFMRKVLSVGKS